MASSLTEDGIKLLNSHNLDVQPFLQVYSLAPIGGTTQHTTRFKLELSDGVHIQKATLPSKYNSLVTTRQIQKGTIIQLTAYTIPTICSSR